MDKSSVRVLVVDDDRDTCNLIVDILEEEGYEVQSCSSGDRALTMLQREHFELVLTDIKMPRISGIDLLRHVHQQGLDSEVILITAYASVETAVQALRGQAFDYLIKPFSLNELRQRVHEAIQTHSSQQRRHIVEHYESLSVDHSARRAWVNGHEASLTRLEFDVLAYLLAHRGRVVSLEELLREVWECDGADERSIAAVRSVIRRLRQNLKDDARNPRFILNVRGIGYQLGKWPDGLWPKKPEDDDSE